MEMKKANRVRKIEDMTAKDCVGDIQSREIKLFDCEKRKES